MAGSHNLDTNQTSMNDHPHPSTMLVLQELKDGVWIPPPLRYMCPKMLNIWIFWSRHNLHDNGTPSCHNDQFTIPIKVHRVGVKAVAKRGGEVS